MGRVVVEFQSLPVAVGAGNSDPFRLSDSAWQVSLCLYALACMLEIIGELVVSRLCSVCMYYVYLLVNLHVNSPEDEPQVKIGPRLDKVCKEELTTATPLASDIKNGGPITVELQDLIAGRYWVTVLDRSRDVGRMDVTTMKFPLCSTVLQRTNAEVSVYTHDGGSQTFLVSKDGDIHGTGRCAWDVVGIDGRTSELHRIYPHGHAEKPKPTQDPFAKYIVDSHGSKILQVPPAPTDVGIGVVGSSWPTPPDNALMSPQPGPYEDDPHHDIEIGKRVPRFPTGGRLSPKMENRELEKGRRSDGAADAQRHVDGNGWRDRSGGVGAGMRRDGELQWPRDQPGIQHPRGRREGDFIVHDERSEGGDRRRERSREGGRGLASERDRDRDRDRDRNAREYEWPDESDQRSSGHSSRRHTPEDYDTWEREQWKRQRRPPNLIRPLWNPLNDFIPPDSVSFYAGTGAISVYPFKNMPALQISVTMWVTTDVLQSAGTLMSYVAGPVEESFTLQESEMDARDLMIWVGGHGQRTGVVIADGYWHFIAVTWSSYDGATFLYVDGMLMFSTIMAKGLAIADGGSLMFGQDQRIDNGWCCSTLPNRAFTGQMAEISLWNKPLGLDDIRAQIDNQKDRAITGVIMQLQFKEPQKAARDRKIELWDKLVPDSSGLHHDAVLVGLPLPTLRHQDAKAPEPPADAGTDSSKEKKSEDAKTRAGKRSSLWQKGHQVRREEAAVVKTEREELQNAIAVGPGFQRDGRGRQARLYEN